MATNQGQGQGQGQGGQSGNDSNRGFAGMDPEKQREIASEGGRAAHASGNAHEFDSEEAREAGSKSHGGHGGKQGQENEEDGQNENRGSGGSGGTQGGTREQHAQAGRQSHKNDR